MCPMNSITTGQLRKGPARHRAIPAIVVDKAGTAPAPSQEDVTAFVSSIVQSAGAPRSLENGAESCRRLQMSL